MIKVYLVKIILVNTHLSLVSRVHVKINDPGKNINFFAGSGQTLFTKITNQTQITITLILQIVCNTMHLSTICSQHKKNGHIAMTVFVPFMYHGENTKCTRAIQKRQTTKPVTISALSAHIKFTNPLLWTPKSAKMSAYNSHNSTLTLSVFQLQHTRT